VATLDDQFENLKGPRGPAFISHEGYRLISYGVAGLTGSLGVGFILGTAVNPVFGFGFAGIGLMASSLGLMSALRTGETRSVTNLSPDAALIKYLSDYQKEATIVTSFSGEALAMNAAYETYGVERRRPLTSLILHERPDQYVAALLERAHKENHLIEMTPSTRPDGGDVRLELTRVGDYVVWHVAFQGKQARLKEAIRVMEERTIPVTRQLGTGLALVDPEGHLLFINEHLRDWHKLGPASPLPNKLRFRDNETRLVVDDETFLHVTVSRVPVPHRDKEEPLGQMVFIFNRPSYVVPNAERGEITKLIDATWDFAPLGVAVVDSDGVILEQNAWIKRFMRDVPNNALALFVEDDHEEVQRKIQTACEGRAVRRPLDVTYVGVNSKSDTRVGQVFFSTILFGGKQYAILYMLDITQQKSLEEQFVQAQKMQAVGQLAGGVAHDFNNLLTAIIGFSDLLTARLDSNDQSFSDVMNIKQNANRAAALTRQLLAFSRQQTMRPKVLMVSDVLAEVSNLLRRLLGDNIDLNLVYGRNIQPVKVDQGQLEQVLINLAVNARDAMEGRGILTVNITMVGRSDAILDAYDMIVPDDYVLVELIDTGSGIEEHNLKKIFEPFFTTKDVGKGTGLGLATVYGIVKQTGGYVFASSNEGEGATFKLFLKAHTPEEGEIIESEREEKAESDLTGSARILLVEDEDAVRMFAARALTLKGYQVVEANSGEEGLELLEDYGDEIDLLITDVIMPNIDGPTLVRAAKKQRPHLPVIFISGYAEDVVRKDLEDDDSYFLPKPFSLQDLAKMVKSIV